MLVDAEARRLVTLYDAAELHSLVESRRLAQEEADRAGADEPSPDALRAYRRATRELAEAERALSLANQAA